MDKKGIQKKVAIIVGLGMLVLVLVVAKKILIPIAIAAVITYLVLALVQSIEETKLGRKIPRWLSGVVSLIVIAGFLYGVGVVLQDNISKIAKKVPLYTTNAQIVIQKTADTFGVEIRDNQEFLKESVNINNVVVKTLGRVTNVTGTTIIIAIYVIFMLVEYRGLRKKVSALFGDDKRILVRKVVKNIDNQVRQYLGIKTIASIGTALLGYGILMVFGIDFPIFWALIIFLLNYIPTVGSIIAVLFPSLLALVQFTSVSTFFIVLGLLVVAQLLVGNVIEPRIAGDKLELSPLVILISLVISSAIWGAVGMILAVPVLIIIKVVTEQFEETRAISVLVSR